MRTILLASILALAMPGARSASVAQGGRPATFDDVLQVKVVGSPMVSPDGAQTLYTVRPWEPTTERGKDLMEGRTRIWKVPTAGSAPARQMTFGERGDTQPRWSPDGTMISFVSARGAAGGDQDGPKPQLYLMRADGGEAQRLTEAPEGVTSYSWSPDSARIIHLTTDSRTPDQQAAIKRRDDERVFEGDFLYTHAWAI